MSEKGKKAQPKSGAKKTASKKPPKKTSDSGEESPRVEVVLGPAPVPSVLSRHGGEMHRRQARGYSFGELQAAGVGLVFARDHGVMVDGRRRSVLEDNVGGLKGWYVPPPKKPKAEAEVGAEEKKPKKRRATRPKKAARAKQE